MSYIILVSSIITKLYTHPSTDLKESISAGLGALGFLGSRRLQRSAFINPVFLTEPLDSSGGVNQLLTTGEEGMAVGTDFDLQILHRRTGLDDIPAGAGDGGIEIFRMNLLFHHNSFLYVQQNICPVHKQL